MKPETIRLCLNVVTLVALSLSAAFWLISARVRLTRIAPGLEELDRVANLADDLQKMGRWNFWAAATTAVAVLLQIASSLA